MCNNKCLLTHAMTDSSIHYFSVMDEYWMVHAADIHLHSDDDHSWAVPRWWKVSDWSIPQDASDAVSWKDFNVTLPGAPSGD